MPPIVAAVASFVAGTVAGGAAIATGIGSIALYSTTYAITSMIAYGAISTIVSSAAGRLFYSSSKSSSDSGQISVNNSGLLVNTESAVTSHRIIYGTRKVGGQVFLKDASDSGPDSDGVTKEGDNLFLHVMIVLAGIECEEITTIYAGDVALTLDGSGFATNSEFSDDAGKHYIRIKKHLGASDQTADTDAVSEIANWTSEHRARGRTYLYVRMQYNKDIFSNIPRFTALVKGKKVYDPRTSTTAWSNNSALCIRDYLKSEYGLNVEDIELNDTYTNASANTCEEAVTLQDASTQDRYTCDTVLERNVQVIDNLQELISSFVGSVVYIQGKFRIHAGAYEAPSVTITEDWLINTVKVQARQSRKETFNAVRGIYINEDEAYEPTDFIPATNSTYETQDGGDRIYADITFSCTTNQERAQRMAKVILEKARQGIMLTLPINFRGLKLVTWDTIYVTLDDLGWSSKVFRISQWQINENGNGINLYCQEESSASYDWNSGEATLVDAAPDTNLTSPFDAVIAPGSPSVVESLYSTFAGAGVKAKALVSWSESTSSFLKEYEVQYKLTTDTDYISAGKVEKDTLSLTVFDIGPGKYDFKVRAINRLGKSSAWASTVIELFGLTTSPLDVVNFSLNAISDNAHLSWDKSEDLDVIEGGSFLIKHVPDTTDPSWSTANLIVPAQPGYATQVTAPLIDGSYLIKAVDSSGNESINTVAIISNVANIVKMNVVVTRQESSTFAGAKTNMVLSRSNLTMTDRTLLSGVYAFSSGVDLGKNVVSRITATLKAIMYDATDLFDSRGGLFDDAQGLFDGADISGIQTKLFVRTTNDDPTGTPTWSAWRQFVVGNYNAWAYEFKMEVASDNITYNLNVSSLSVTVDMPDITDRGSLTTGSGAADTISFNKDFVTDDVNIGISILNAQSGDYETITSIGKNSFTIEIKDSTNTRVIRNINWIATAY